VVRYQGSVTATLTGEPGEQRLCSEAKTSINRKQKSTPYLSGVNCKKEDKIAKEGGSVGHNSLLVTRLTLTSVSPVIIYNAVFPIASRNLLVTGRHHRSGKDG